MKPDAATSSAIEGPPAEQLAGGGIIAPGPFQDRLFPRYEPPVIRRDARRQRLLEILTLFILASILPASLWFSPAMLPLLPLAVLGVIACLIGRRVLRRRLEQRIDRVRTNRYEHCLHCGYQLTGLPASHCCPECGNLYELSDVVNKWQAWMAELSRPAPSNSDDDPYVLRTGWRFSRRLFRSYRR